MSTETQVTEHTNEWIIWIEEAITKEYLRYYEYKYFSDIQDIGTGGFGKVSRAKWKNSEQYLALKSFFCLDNATVKEIVCELKLQRKVDYHSNVIRSNGITKIESGDKNNYLLVMEYADGGTLQNYLKKNFNDLTWTSKYHLAYQLACAVSCLHDEEIVHRDLHSGNVLVHQDIIKLSDFGLSKRIEDASKRQSKLFGVIPYVDPKRFVNQKSSNKQYSLNKKSDVYSVGVLLWMISSGQPPFYMEGESYDGGLAVQILQGLRETPIPDTPIDYVKLYTECWNGEPDNRPTMQEVVNRLKAIILQSNMNIYHQPNEMTYEIPNEHILTSNIGLWDGYTQILQNFGNIKTNEMEHTASKNILSKEDFSIIVDELVDLISRDLNKGKGWNVLKQNVVDYLKNHNVYLHNWPISDYQNANAIFLLGYFNYSGIETSKNQEETFNLFHEASEKDHLLAQYYVGECYLLGYGIMKDEKFAFKYFVKVANEDYAAGQLRAGYCYNTGIGIKKDLKIASSLYEKSANNGNIIATHNLGLLYLSGNGVDKNHKKAFELFEKSAKGEYSNGVTMLGHCYQNGIGINANKQRAFELYQMAANLGNEIAQYNVALMYETGDGIVKDINKAMSWYEKSVEQGYQKAQNRLDKLKSKIRKRNDSCKIN